MDSRIFVRNATALIEEIKEFSGDAQGSVLQRDINAAFSGLQNPTLPTAEKLAEVATRNGFAVAPQVLARIRGAQGCWQQGY